MLKEQTNKKKKHYINGLIFLTTNWETSLVVHDKKLFDFDKTTRMNSIAMW